VYGGTLSGVTLDGGDDNDKLVDGPGSNFLSGGSGDDGIEGHGGNDVINAGDGNDLIVIPMPTNTSFPTVVGGGGADVLDVQFPNGPDTVHVWKPSGYDVQVDELTGTTATGTVRATGIEEVDTELGGGADTITVETLVNSSVGTVSVDLGQTITSRSEEHTSELQSRGHLVC